MAAPKTDSAKSKPQPRWIGDIGTLVVIFSLLGAVYLLPSDSSLSEVKRTGRFTVCMPELYPPLITGDPQKPGFDVELLGLVAQRLGLNFAVVSNAAMSRDFNPRSWRVTRAQCAALAGGVALTRPVLSYLDATKPYLETGWAVVSTAPLTSLDGHRVAFYAGLNGLDRLALSRTLRAAGIRPKIVNSQNEIVAGLKAGDFDSAITESLTASQIAEANGYRVSWLNADSARYPLGVGFWKGDLTLKRAVATQLDALEADGTIAGLREKYGIDNVTATVALGGKS